MTMMMRTRIMKRMIVTTIECSSVVCRKAARFVKTHIQDNEVLARTASITTSVAKRADCIIA
jgi:hypothetical protein